jgi:2-polyprenyl-6-methoxyphenol hydroxylase-like FAD-dependent oxidoreductase
MPGVSLVGDGAHLMPPAGDGANLAMLDGAELGAAIAAAHGDIEPELAAYEKRMFARSTRAAMDTRRIQDPLLGDRAPLGLIDFFADARR